MCPQSHQPDINPSSLPKRSNTSHHLCHNSKWGRKRRSLSRYIPHIPHHLLRNLGRSHPKLPRNYNAQWKRRHANRPLPQPRTQRRRIQPVSLRNPPHEWRNNIPNLSQCPKRTMGESRLECSLESSDYTHRSTLSDLVGFFG